MEFLYRARRIVYVDGDNGLDTGNGSRSNPVLTLGAAFAILGSNGGGRAIILPAETPLAPLARYDSSYDVSVESDDIWYMEGTSGDNYGINAYGLGTLTLGLAHISGPAVAVLVGRSGAPEGGGMLVAADCYAEGATNGWLTDYLATGCDLTRCVGLGVANDGFGFHGTIGHVITVTVTDCIGDDCGDEGISPHENVVLTIRATGPDRSHFNGNQEAGCTAVGDSTCNIYGPVEMSGNGLGGGGYGGVFYGDNAGGSIGELVDGDGGPLFVDNVGAGVNVGSTAGVVDLGAYTSEGNGAPDVLS